MSDLADRMYPDFRTFETMENPLILGLTGGIGSGKSTVARLFEISGYPVFYADHEAKLLYTSSPEVKEAVIQLLGALAYAGDQPNRAYIASQVFGDSDLLMQLNKILHPAVRQRFKKWLVNHAHAEMVVREAAILFESQSHTDCHFTLTITAPEQVRIQRVMQRDAVSNDDVKRRILNQWSDAERRACADFEVINDDHTLVIPQLRAIIAEIKIRSGALAQTS